MGAPIIGDDRKIAYEIGDLEAGVPGSVLLTLVLPPRKPGTVRMLQSGLHYTVPGGSEDRRVAILPSNTRSIARSPASATAG